MYFQKRCFPLSGMLLLFLVSAPVPTYTRATWSDIGITFVSLCARPALLVVTVAALFGIMKWYNAHAYVQEVQEIVSDARATVEGVHNTVESANQLVERVQALRNQCANLESDAQRFKQAVIPYMREVTGKAIVGTTIGLVYDIPRAVLWRLPKKYLMDWFHDDLHQTAFELNMFNDATGMSQQAIEHERKTQNNIVALYTNNKQQLQQDKALKGWWRVADFIKKRCTRENLNTVRSEVSKGWFEAILDRHDQALDWFSSGIKTLWY